MPDRIKRLLLRGRSITIDGNTLDTTLQLSLAASRLSGREGLILSEDPATARTRLNARGGWVPAGARRRHDLGRHGAWTWRRHSGGTHSPEGRR